MTASENQIVVYQPNETVRLDVRLANETVWLTQEQIANLFGTKRPAITKHLANIYKSGELEREGTCSILEHMGNDGRQSYRTMFYNLDAILSVGYRVNSRNATLFRRWATQVLKAYLLKGYAVNERMNQLEDKVDRRLAKHDSDIAELKEKVDFFVQTKEPPLQGIFYQNKFWDAKSLLIKFIRRAKKELIVIDAYPGVATLDMLAKRGRGVKIELVTHSNGELVESVLRRLERNAASSRRPSAASATTASSSSSRRKSSRRVRRSRTRAASHSRRRRWARRSFPGCLIQSARRRRNSGNTAKV